MQSEFPGMPCCCSGVPWGCWHKGAMGTLWGAFWAPWRVTRMLSGAMGRQEPPSETSSTALSDQSDPKDRPRTTLSDQSDPNDRPRTTLSDQSDPKDRPK